MKKWLFIALLVAFPSQVFGAVGFGAGLGQSYAGGVSTRSLTGLSITGTDLLLTVATYSEVTSYTVTSCVWDDGSGGSSQTMTQQGTYLNVESGNHRMGLFTLLDPNTSNSRILCTFSGSSVHGIGAVYYTGVDSLASFATTQDTASGATITNTSTANGSWHLTYSMSANAGLTISSGATARQNLFGTSIHIADSNATVANGATHDFVYTWSSGNAGFNDLMLLPVVVTPPLDLTSTSTEIRYQDWLLMNTLIVMCLSVLVYGVLFSPVKR